MPRLRRRGFVLGGGLTAATGVPLSLVFSRRARGAGRYGPLERDPNGILDLPAGFSYRVIETVGAPMDDGYIVPGLPDGMACFPGPDGTLVLMRNHELRTTDTLWPPYRPGQSPPPHAYDPAHIGGVTRLVIDDTTFERVSSNLVLVGTERNCAGGISPWGWLSCEEAVSTGHGYVFLCSTEASSVQGPVRIVPYGRFRHEAAVVDPATNICYLTEDRSDGCLYRFVPDVYDDPFVGTLQALRLTEMPDYDTGVGMPQNEPLDVEWIDIDDPDPLGDTVRTEAQSKGATIFRRGEGVWFADGGVYFASTSGGEAGGGQIFRLIPARKGSAATLELLAESPGKDVLDMPDNLCVAPWGEVFMAEDDPGTDNHIRVLARDGEICDFARNVWSDSELAGVCFSPDGAALFVNLYKDGLTLVITGPFPTEDDGDDGDDGGTDTGSGDDGADGGDGETSDGASDGGAGMTGAPTGEHQTLGQVDSELACACDADDTASSTGALMTAALALTRKQRST